MLFVWHMHIFSCLKPAVPVHTRHSSPARVESISSLLESCWPVTCSNLQNVAKVTPCWPQGWAFRNLTTSAFGFLKAPRHYVKKSPASLFLPVGERGNGGTRHASQASRALRPPVKHSQPTPLGADTSSPHPALPASPNWNTGMVCFNPLGFGVVYSVAVGKHTLTNMKLWNQYETCKVTKRHIKGRKGNF